MVEVIKDWCNAHLNLLRFVMLIVFMLCCYTIWCRFTENDTGTQITDTSITEQITEVERNQSAVTNGLAESAEEVGSIGTEVRQLREQAADSEGRIKEAGTIIRECEQIISGILKADESTNH